MKYCSDVFHYKDLLDTSALATSPDRSHVTGLLDSILCCSLRASLFGTGASSHHLLLWHLGLTASLHPAAALVGTVPAFRCCASSENNTHLFHIQYGQWTPSPQPSVRWQFNKNSLFWMQGTCIITRLVFVVSGDLLFIYFILFIYLFIYFFFFLW